MSRNRTIFFNKTSKLTESVKHEQDCHSRANEQDRMRQKRIISEINESEICQKISLNTVHEWQMRTAISVINKNEQDKSC
jgi:hypothetical protein